VNCFYRELSWFFSMLVFERVGGMAVEAKRGGASNLLMGEPGKSVMPLRTLEEIFIPQNNPGNRPVPWGVDPTGGRMKDGTNHGLFRTNCQWPSEVCVTVHPFSSASWDVSTLRSAPLRPNRDCNVSSGMRTALDWSELLEIASMSFNEHR